ncbi:ABC transporter substrate-binding protein [Paenibacillaceae bacterium WGS1546]|uniref:ABC transporter substrate-binding protein n=1 Tax=Cohnella sp. WGS1546 TaxID=3366810 RepID=UPI00372CE7F3
MKKSVLLLSLCFVLLLSACSSNSGNGGSGASPAASGEDAGGERIELEFWTINLKEGYSDYITGKIADYEADRPNVKINWIDVPDFDQTDAKLLAAISGGQAPDVVNLTPFMIPKFVRSGALAAVDELRPEIKDMFVPAFWDAGVVNGKAYGIPFYGSVPGMFINTRLFEEAGLDPDKPPASWEEVISYSETIKEKTGVAGNMQTIDNFADSGNPIDILARRGVQMLSDDQKTATFNSPEGVRVLTEFVDMYNSGALHPDSMTGAMMDAAARFSEEKVAMIFPGPWMLRWLKENTSESSFANFKVYPGLVGNDGKLNSFLQTFVVPAGSQHPEEALDFAVYFSGTVIDLIKQAPVAPGIAELLDDPIFREGPEELGIISDGLPLAEFYWPLVPGLTEMIEALRNAFQEATLGSKSPQDALDDAAAKWNNILAKS